MSNFFEYQEIMAASFQYGTTKTVAEVVAAHELRHLQQENEAAAKRRNRMPSRPGAPAQLTTGSKPIPQSSINELKQLMERTGMPVPAALQSVK